MGHPDCIDIKIVSGKLEVLSSCVTDLVLV